MERRVGIHSPEFKENAVFLSYTNRSVRETAEKLEISPKLLSKWRAIHGKFKKGSFPGSGRKRFYCEDIKIFKLEKKLQEPHMKLEILKKGIEIKPQGKQAVYNFIFQNKKKYPIGVMCQVLGVSSSIYNLRIQHPLSKREIQVGLYTVKKRRFSRE